MKRHEYVGRNILAEMARRGITVGEMANGMDLSNSTFHRRMRKPWELTIQNLDDAAEVLGVPLEHLLKKGA